MFKATRLTLTAAAVIAAAGAPAAAQVTRAPSASQGTHVFENTPRGTAIVLGQTQSASPVRGREAVSSESSPSDRGPAPGGLGTQDPRTTASRYPGLVPGSAVSRYPGLVPGSATTRYPGLVPGSSVNSYPGLVPNTGHPTAQARESEQAPASGAVTAAGGFDWGDGAIGALVALAVMAAGLAAIVLARRRTSSLARTEPTSSLARTHS
jgi:hypothetical protein